MRRVVLATAATVSGIVLLLSLKPAADPAAASAAGRPAPQQTAAAQQSPQGGASPAGSAEAQESPDGGAPSSGTAAAQEPSQGGASSQTAAVPESPQAGTSSQTTDAPESPQTGTVTGSVAQTEYGPVQVRITLRGGQITKAEAVQAPSGGRSSQVTDNAVPKLNQQAVTAQSADIDAVSGATYTSAGYKQSLQSALDQAGG
jgi:uncharacterized protein with FMN-binding domain